MFDTLFDSINNGVEALFSIPNIALWIAFALFAWCGAIIFINARRIYGPFRRRLRERLDDTAFIDEPETDATAREVFAQRFGEVDAAMAAAGRGAAGLRHAWGQFRETIVDPADEPLRATTRPEGYFLHLGDGTRVLAWWANIFVAVGLTFTFLGIVAALHKTVTIMSAGADQAGMLSALTGLLRITAAKFWTSIGGVASSIALRIVDRRWHSASLRGLERLCDRLERGTLFSPPQRIAADHLRELRRQTELLGGFRPAAGGVTDGDAGAQISRAARDFVSASEQMTIAFTTLNARIEGLAGKLAEQAEEAGTLASRRIVEEREAYQAVADGQRKVMIAVGEEMARAATAATAEMVRAIQGAVAASMREGHAAATGNATLLQGAGVAVGDAGRDVREAAAGLAGVAAPIRDAARGIAEALAATQAILHSASARAERHEAAMQATAEGLASTGEAAGRAWESYRVRFEEVDASLARALERIADTSAEHAQALNDQVARIDGALAQAVDRLSAALANAR